MLTLSNRQFTHLAATAALVYWAAAVPANASSITPISQPTPFYLANTTLIDISKLTDGSKYPCISTSYTLGPTYSCNGGPSNGGLTVNLFSSMVRLTVPTSWAGWGSPKATEKTAGCPAPLKSCPPVLWSNGSNDVIMSLNAPEEIFGFEAEPNTPGPNVMQATFYDAQGNQIGVPITLTPSGYNGALLFAASSDTPFKTVSLDDLGPDGKGCPTCDFAIANVRFSPNQIPEPSPAILLGIGLVGLVALRTLYSRL